MGLAAAEYADTRSAEHKQAAGQLARLASEGKAVLEGVARTRAQLAGEVAAARRSNDRLLSTCLEAALDDVDQLNTKASSRWAALAAASAEGPARLSLLVITVIGQKVNLVAQQAARCVGADRQQPELSQIAGPTDPNASGGQSGDDFDPTLRPQGSGFTFAPPPPASPSSTNSPSTGDEPMGVGVPPMPTAASPVM